MNMKWIYSQYVTYCVNKFTFWLIKRDSCVVCTRKIKRKYNQGIKSRIIINFMLRMWGRNGNKTVKYFGT